MGDMIGVNGLYGDVILWIFLFNSKQSAYKILELLMKMYLHKALKYVPSQLRSYLLTFRFASVRLRSAILLNFTYRSLTNKITQWSRR